MKRRVAITGCGAVTPIGTGIPAYYDGLRAARSGISTIARFDAATFASRVAGEVKDLDWLRTPLPAGGEAALRRDPKSVFGLIAAREALDQAFGTRAPASYYPARRIGTFAASGLEIFHLEDLAPHLAAGSLDAASLRRAVEASPADAGFQIPAHLGARCIARLAGARGPFSVNVSACAAGTQAIGEAFLAIREGAVDAAVAGGYDSMINPLGVGGFCMLGALSTSNARGAAASRPFDARRDGFVLGEGAGMCVLEELEAARRRGARVLGEVLGYGSALDAFRVSDPHPEQAGAIRAMRAALASAELAPEEIDYINAHGTGTRKNDPAETRAIRAVFPGADRLPVSSTKSQIGHLIGAAGAVELLACLFALEHQLLPATINLSERDPECDLDYVANAPRPANVRTCLSNSFGFGGQNAVIAVGAVR